MPIWKNMKGMPMERLAAKGLMYHDWTALSPCQKECNMRMGMTIQQEQEAYLSAHPEVKAMLELFMCKMTRSGKRKDILKEAAEYFTRPDVELDKEIRERLGIPLQGPHTKESTQPTFTYEDINLEQDLKNITLKHYPPETWAIPTPYESTVNTPSSTFLSIVTSDTTVPTPEPVRTPDPTISEVFFGLVSNTVDKAIFSHVDDRALRYDTAFVELKKCVEEAMEIPVAEIKEDIAELYFNAYKMFELIIQQKEKEAAEIAWEKRMRKKLKRTLRRLHNFKGYETPPTPKSVISSHDSYKRPPPRPCTCHPQFNYNRYAKDRFGIYQPRNEEFSDVNVTATPAISIEDLTVEHDAEKIDSKKSCASARSTVDKKTTFKS